MSFSVDRVFVAPRPLSVGPRPVGGDDDGGNPTHPSRLPAVIRAAAWPVAIILVFHRVAIVALNGDTTDDFTTVYSAVRRFFDGVPVYDQAYNHVDPLYLYNPGATLLLSPLGLSGNLELMRAGFIVLNALAIIAALAILTRLVDHKLSGALFPAAIAIAFASESVTNTLTFSNINGVLLLALSIFLWGVVRGVGGDTSPRRPGLLWLAGVAIGLAIVIKPQFAPLLFLPFVRLEWRSIVAGLTIPVGLNLIAWPIIPGAGDYFGKLVPYLGTTRDYANASLPGLKAYFGISDAAYYPLWLAVAACVAIGVIVLLRWRVSDTSLWAMTTSGLLLVGVFLLSSLGQQYYSMWLFPAMFTVVFARSVFHSWPAWLAAACYLLPVTWHSTHFADAGRWLSVYVGTLGWLLLVIAITATALGWWLSQPSKHQPSKSVDCEHD